MAGMGEILSTLRKQKGVTQEEMGKALGVSMQAVSRWENGGAPDIMLLPALADYFGVSITSCSAGKADPSRPRRQSSSAWAAYRRKRA